MYSVKEILQFIAENDVKFVRLSFCDSAGRLKNVSIMPVEVEKVFEAGYLFEAAAVFGTETGQLKLMPDPNSLTAMPWRPAQGRVIRFFCDIKTQDGAAFGYDHRFALRKLTGKIASRSGKAICPFCLVKTDQSGKPTGEPWDEGGFMDTAPSDRGENVRRELCLSLEEMKIAVLASYHGVQFGQNIIEFGVPGLAEAADFVVAFRSAAQAIAARNGLYADFASGKTVVSADGYTFDFASESNPYSEIERLLQKTL